MLKFFGLICDFFEDFFYGKSKPYYSEYGMYVMCKECNKVSKNLLFKNGCCPFCGNIDLIVVSGRWLQHWEQHGLFGFVVKDSFEIKNVKEGLCKQPLK